MQQKRGQAFAVRTSYASSIRPTGAKKKCQMFLKQHKRSGFMTFLQCEKNRCLRYYVLLYNGFSRTEEGHKPETFVFVRIC